MSQASAAQRLLQRCVLQPYWRWQRPLTLGAQGVVVGEDGRVLLVKHTYRPGWCFPGGGVEKGETVLTALTRELYEECGVVIDHAPELFAIYSNHTRFPNDHVALFVVRHWHRSHVPEPNSEIAAQDFFTREPLPQDCAHGTAKRIDEIFNGAPRDELW